MTEGLFHQDGAGRDDYRIHAMAVGKGRDGFNQPGRRNDCIRA